MSEADRFNALVFTQVINLDRSPARLASIARALDGAGVAFVRLSASDGRQLDLARDPEVTGLFDLKAWMRRHHRNPTPADIGCYLSHYRAIGAFLAQPKPFGLIFEDDADVSADIIEALLPALADARSWDILKLHARHPGPLIARHVYANGRTLASFVVKHAGATGYAVQRHAAERMLRHLRPAVRMIDWAYDEGHVMNLRVRALSPFPVGLQTVASTIEVERGDKGKRSWIERHADRPLAPRWALPFRRFVDDIHRLSFNLFQDGGLQALMFGPKRGAN